MRFLLIFFFFFSSRRRHTRCGRDWSSDVCSSDLSPSTWPLSAIEKHLEIYHHHHILLLFLKAFDSFQKTNLIKVNVDTVKKKDFVFIMDEMNNVDVTQIFGERSEEHTSELQSRPQLVCR